MTNPIPIKKTPFDELPPEQLEIAKNLTLKLTTIGFSALFVRAEAGPIVTTYFFKPLPTSPLNKLMSKSEDLAMSVGVESILIQRVLDEVSIAVPNRTRHSISFDECLYNLARGNGNLDYQLPILMGKDTRGGNVGLDLAEQPHILIAGSTGGGKSVFLSELICSLAVMKSPEELKFVLVDTKQLDLTLFSKLDHVIEMVDKVEDLHSVMDGLLKIVRERTEMMKGKFRNIGEFNKFIRERPFVSSTTPIVHLNSFTKELPYIVLVIDELADVIGQDKELAKSEDSDSRRTRISASLASLAQISRAAGVHIIAATQRPSVQIISGDIKTNFPTRICFRLPSGGDSRVVLDENGAENLLGKGDYLYRTANDGTVRRAHGAFVSMENIRNILEQHEMIRNSFRQMRGL